MHAFLAHLRKEIRDQRTIWIAVASSLPLLTCLAFWAFASRLVEAPIREAAPVIVAIALVLYLFAFGGDLFAGDARRGTLDFLRRQPRGLAHAFHAKTLLFLAGFVAVVLWESVILWAAWRLWGRSLPLALSDIVNTAWRSPWIWGMAALGAWVLLASVWLKRGGIAVLLAPLLLGALIVPAVVWGRAHPVLARFLVPEPDRAALWIGLLLVALPFVAAAWSYLGGRRFARSAWSAAWRGLVVVLVVTSGVYAFAALRLQERLELTPTSSGFRIQRALASPDGGRLFLEVLRTTASGDAWTPPRTWTVDVGTGTWVALGDWGETVDAPRLGGMWPFPGGLQSSIEPQPRLLLHRARSGADEPIQGWVDSATGEILKVVPASVRTPDVLSWSHEAGRVATWVRDDAGRRVWLENPTWDTTLFREGVEHGEQPEGARGWYHGPIPGGWAGFPRGSHSRLLVLDASTARATEVPREISRWGGHLNHALSPRVVLVRAEEEERERGGWVLADLHSSEREVLEGSSADIAGIWVLDRHCVLGLTGDRPRRLVIWDPEGGTQEDPGWPWTEPMGIADVRIAGRDADGVLAFTVRHDEGWGVAVLDPRTRELRVLADDLRASPMIFALLDDGAALAIEDGRRVVRYGPQPGSRTLLFPR